MTTENRFRQLFQFLPEIVGFMALSFIIASDTFNIPIDIQSEIEAIGAALFANVIFIAMRIRQLSKLHLEGVSTVEKSIKDLGHKFEMQIDGLTHRIEIQSEIIRNLLEKEDNDEIEIEILETPYEFYRALNTAREESYRTIRVMKLHHMGPSDADHDQSVADTSPESELSDARMEMKRWYEGLGQWNRPGRLVERVATNPGKSMEKFLAEARKAMAGTSFAQHILPWDGELPLLNLCVFDDTQVILTFSTQSWENPYRPVPGIRIKNKGITRFFRERYYDRLVQYCSRRKNA